MANPRSKAWGPTHPSAAFLIKCAKEREKLRSTLQAQLQDHMLSLLENKLFTDIKIGINSEKHFSNENNSSQQSHDIPEFIHSHKSILKVRAPTFYKHLQEHKESKADESSFNSYLEESELTDFLRRVYTDDDVRKYEHEALRLSKKYIDLLCQNKGPVNKHILEIDEYEKESVTSTCTDNFVTPKSTPISPEKKLDVCDMFKTAQNSVKETLENLANIIPESYTMKTVDEDLHHVTDLPNGYPIVPKQKSSSAESRSSKNSNDCAMCINEIRGEINRSDNAEFSLEEDENSDQESEHDEYSNIGSMVRSNTFDLETQGSLEENVDDSIEWCSRPTSDSDFRDDSNERGRDSVSSRRLDSTGFFLHDHTPSPKSNIFKHGFPKELYGNGHEVDNSPGVHIRRLDGSMSDSGFMSHSTFSVISDTGFPNSVSSSLIMSADEITSSSYITGSEGTELNVSDLEKSKQLSGSMFPFYIDINSLPSSSSSQRKEKKSNSPSHAYMYIDARSPRRSIRKKQPYLNTSYDEFFSEFEAEGRYSKKDPLMKAQSTSQLDMCKSDYPVPEASGKDGRFRPQSCYMYVDLEAVKSESDKALNSNFSATNLKQEPSAVSMFINLNDSNDNSTSDSLSNKELKTNSFEAEEDIQNKINHPESDHHLPDKEPNLEEKRKFSESSLSLIDQFRNNHKSSLSKRIETRSSSAIDYNSVIRQESAMYRKTGLPRKARSAHRYSDGVFYDSLYQQKLFPNFCNQNDGKVYNDSKIKDLKISNQTFKLLHSLNKDEESSGSCSNLGKITTDEKLFSSDKIKWKSTGDMGKPKSATSEDQNGLLPMSPILRRKSQVRDQPKSAPPPVVVKASTKPQDVDAMTFPKSLKDDSLKLTNKLQDEPKSDSSPCHKKSENEDSRSSSESSKIVYEVVVPQPTDAVEVKDKNADCMSRSGSSLSDHCHKMTISGGDSSSEKYISDALKEKIPHSSLSLSFSCDFDDDSETIYSEVSDVSSLGNISGIASLERRWREGQNRQGETVNKNLITTQQMLEACSKLGEDLLRMFLEEVDTDITLEVEGKEIKAHRCILSSRCKYFANLLRTSNPDKNSSRISLEGFTYSAVHFALCHIYSGAMSIPKDCNISELALLADMLNLETLTDVIVFHLKMHFCHFFHRPCLQCTQGVVECLPLAMVCGLTELRDKCIYWLGKYFTRTWPNKSFAALSEELRDLCYNVTTQNITIDSVIEMTLNCDRLMTTLPQLKWTEPIFGMVTRLLQDCIHFMAKTFNEILNAESFLALGKGQSWNVTALEEDIISAVELTTPDVACKSYVSVNQLISLAESAENSEYSDFTQNFVDLLHKISRHCERYLIQNANKVVHCQSWACLAPQVQKRIKDAAVIVFEFEKPTAPPPRLSSLQRKLKKQNEAEELNSLERSTYPKKGRSIQKKYQRDMNFPKSSNSMNAQEMSDRNMQRRDTENLVKKIVSPIKEEANNNSVENSLDILSCALNPYSSSVKSHLSNKLYVDAHEEDSLRDLQDLPQDHSQSPSHYTNGVDNNVISNSASLDVDEGRTRSPAHCSDNPDSLETNDISSDSKEDIDVSVSVEDGSNQEKGVIETPEVLNKNFEFGESKKDENIKNLESSNTHGSSLPKSTFSIPTRDKVPHLQPLVPHINEKNTCLSGEKSPVKKLQGKSLLPLAKAHTIEDKSPVTTGKDLVAEIDADSKMVNHCLQEAEMLEQQLSRKLQRQHQDGSSNISHYIQHSPARGHTPSEHKGKSYGSRLQKASSTSQIKSLAGASVRGKSPGRIVKSNASSPSIGHAPRLIRSSETREKVPPRKSSQSPKASSAHRSFRSMESIASVHKQLSVSSAQGSKRVSSKSNRPRTIVNNARTPIIGPK